MTAQLKPWPYVRDGDQTQAVRDVQHLLRGHDYVLEVDGIRAEVGNPDLDVTVDGIFGPRTDAAVRTFQEGVSRAVPSFPIDGIVGPLTWQALTGGMLAD